MNDAEEAREEEFLEAGDAMVFRGVAARVGSGPALRDAATLV